MLFMLPGPSLLRFMQYAGMRALTSRTLRQSMRHYMAIYTLSFVITLTQVAVPELQVSGCSLFTA